MGDSYSFDGTHYRLVDCPALPKPVQRPHPPVIVGGTGPRRTPAIAAGFADEFNLPPFNTPDAVAVAFARVRAACDAIGRDPDTLEYSVTLTTVCGANRADIERRGAVPPAQFHAADCAGTPDQVLEQLLAYRDVGATRAYLRLLDLRDVEHITLLGDEVLPGVTRASTTGSPSAAREMPPHAPPG